MGNISLNMKKIWIIFTFVIFAFSLILNSFSNAQIKNIDFTDKTPYTQTAHNQNECASMQENDNKECQNACDTGFCDCVNHSCTMTISLFHLAENYKIVPLSDNNRFSSDIEYKLHDINYHIIHPPQA